MKLFTKKLSLLVAILVCGFHVNSQNYLVTVGSEIYEVDPQNCTENMLCDIVVNTGGGTLSSTIADIAYHPNGNLYAIVANYFISIDLGTCTSTTIATHSTGSNALVAAADGTLYAANDDLYTVDPTTGVFTSLGTLPCISGGDLAFESGDLYLTCDNGDLVLVDIATPSNSTIIGNLGTGYWHGLWTVFTDCNNSHVLAATQNELYEVDLSNANTTFSCALGTSWIAGATMQGDYNASECGCAAIDLGPNQDLCSGPVVLDATTPDANYLWQDGSTNPTFTASTPGTYYVEITDTIEACTNSDTIVVGPTTPNSGTTGSTTVCATDSPFDLFTILGGNPDTGGTWSPTLNSGTGVFDPNIDNGGTYTYTVTNTCGTENTDVDVSVIECGMGFNESHLNITTYPNPSSGEINILLSENMDTKIIITDITGRIAYENTFFSQKINLNLSSLATGTYFLSVLNKDTQVLTSEKVQLIK